MTPLKIIDTLQLEERVPLLPLITEDGTEEIICSYCLEDVTRIESNGYKTDADGDIICAKCWHLYFNLGGMEI